MPSQEFGIPVHSRDRFADRWWQREEYRDPSLGASSEEIDAAISRVALVFTPGWAATAKRNPAWGFLFMRGLQPLRSLFTLGSDLLAVENAPRLQSLIKELRTASHHASARMELALAAMFTRNGCSVEFQPHLFPSRKRSDLLVYRDQSVYIEIKSLGDSDAWRATRELNFCLLDRVPDLFTAKPELRFQIELKESLLGVLGKGQADVEAILRLTSGTVFELTRRLELGETAFQFECEGLLRVTVGSDLPETLVWGPPSDPISDLRRMLSKFLHNAGEQLHPDHPGILVCKLKTYSELDSATTRLVLEPLLAADEHARHVSAVVFLPLFISYPSAIPLFRPFAVLNPAATHPAPGLTTYKVLAKHFNLDDAPSEQSDAHVGD